MLGIDGSLELWFLAGAFISSVVGGIIGGVSDLIGGREQRSAQSQFMDREAIFNQASAREAMNFSADQARLNRQFQADQARKAMHFETQSVLGQWGFQRERENAAYGYNAAEARKARQFSAAEAATSRGFGARQASLNRQFSRAEAVRQRDWQENMSNTAYSRAMRDMARAGLNPILAYKQGGASTPSGGMASGSMPSSPMASSSQASGSTSPGSRGRGFAGSGSAAQGHSARMSAQSPQNILRSAVNSGYTAALQSQDFQEKSAQVRIARRTAEDAEKWGASKLGQEMATWERVIKRGSNEMKSWFRNSAKEDGSKPTVTTENIAPARPTPQDNETAKSFMDRLGAYIERAGKYLHDTYPTTSSKYHRSK